MEPKNTKRTGKWHGDSRYFGLHYDLHGSAKDTELGTRCSEEELVPMLQLMDPDFVQTDCKGHAGYLSWFSKVPASTMPDGLTHDAMDGWRKATRKLGLPLHCHYSGVWDKAAGNKFPDWCVVTADGKQGGAPFGQNAGAGTGEIMCPRSPYLDELMIPQMLELIDRYGVDGFWVDGDIWAVKPCYCPRCRAAWTEETGLADPPVSEEAPEWNRWWKFTLQSFYSVVTRYCDAVHQHKPGVLVCSNWLQTFMNPGEPLVPTDWISGDNASVWGLDRSRCEARFLSTRGKQWDIMLWAFYQSHGLGQPDSPSTFKPPQMLMQEAAVLLAFGGNVQLYEHPPVRDGRLIEWRQRRMGEVGRFIKERRKFCQHTDTFPQIAVLHSENHLFANAKGRSLLWGVNAAPVMGAVCALLENSYGVDVLDEWALLPRLSEFPLVVVPEQIDLSEEAVVALKNYVRDGGVLWLTGAGFLERFGEEFLGFRCMEEKENATFALAAGDGETLLHSKRWLLGEATTGEAFSRMGRGCLLEDRIVPHPPGAIHRVGEGGVCFLPADLFTDFQHNHYSLSRMLVGEWVKRLLPDPAIRVEAPVCIDVTLRQRGSSIFVHLVNRISGIPNTKNNGAVDEIPRIGPIRVSVHLPSKPDKVAWHLDEGSVEWNWHDSILQATVSAVHIHGVLEIQTSEAA